MAMTESYRIEYKQELTDSLRPLNETRKANGRLDPFPIPIKTGMPGL